MPYFSPFAGSVRYFRMLLDYLRYRKLPGAEKETTELSSYWSFVFPKHPGR